MRRAASLMVTSLATLFLLAACGRQLSSAGDDGAITYGGDCEETGTCSTCSTASECPPPEDACLVPACKNGVCTSAPVTCTAEDECHDVGECAPATGVCSSPAKADGTGCTGGQCKAGVCLQAIEVLARQDFEETPAAPTWAFTGNPVYNSGTSGENAAPPNSPIGIGNSRAWETTYSSSGTALEFENVVVPAGFDRVRLRFRLAAMNLISTGGGPDYADYVLVALSLDGGSTYYNRIRVRGATVGNTVWAYDATGVAKVDHEPKTEEVFQPTTSGVQTTSGYSTVEIVFPGTVTQVRTRITARSSSTSDTWLIDDVTLTGERTFE